MNRKNAFRLLSCTLASLFVFIAAHSAFSEDKEGLAGWELGSEYNNLYNAKEMDRLKGVITKFIEVTPLPGMAEGAALMLDEGDGEQIQVHICPVAYAEANKTGLQKGVVTKIRGSWAVIDGKDVFLASKIKQGEHFELKVRLTKDGTPFWTMSPEELAKELASN